MAFKREGSKRNVSTTTLLTQGTETPHLWPQSWGPGNDRSLSRPRIGGRFFLFKAHRCVVPGTVARMPMVGESFPNERSESPRKLVLLVIALVIFHIGAFVSLYAIFRLYEYSPQPEHVLVVCVLWPFALFGLLLMKSDNPKLHDF